MKPKLVVLDGYTLNPGDLSWQAFETLAELTVYDRSGDLVRQRAAGAPLVLTNKDLLSAEILSQLADLRYIGVLATGTNIVDIEAATRQGIVVTNVPGYGAESVSQHAFALLLELTNAVGTHARAVDEGQWTGPDFCFTVAPLSELAGKTLGIVGMGAIGGRVAQIGSAFGMRIAAAYQQRMQQINVSGVDIQWLPLDELFVQADVVSLHCPLTDETRHLVNAERLARMKRSALLINTGRGPLVDEAALAAALHEERIAGAALDVLSVEPPTEGNPLIGIDHCLVTPHVAWATVEARGRLMQIAADNLRAFLDGSPTNVVNPEVLN